MSEVWFREVKKPSGKSVEPEFEAKSVWMKNLFDIIIIIMYW